jgi:carotenoid cleavage dioxygenase-like enzyme
MVKNINIFIESAWGIIKIDNSLPLASSNSNTISWKGDICYPSEAVFVPSPGSKAGDDGVLLSQVYDANRKESFLLVLNATTSYGRDG